MTPTDNLADVLRSVIAAAEAAPPAALADAYRAMLRECIGAVSAAREEAERWRLKAADAERDAWRDARDAESAARTADYQRRRADAAWVRDSANGITAGLGVSDAVTVFGRLHALADAIERGPGGAP